MGDGDARRQLVLVDGRSGAGKTQWASELAERSNSALLSLDDLYPGWDGLDAGSWQAYQRGIAPWAQGRTARLRTWDWSRGKWGALRDIGPEQSLIVEGCGALSRFSAPHATARYWLEADDEVRKQRALERDGDTFRPHWLRWALQEDRFYRLHRSRDLADSIIRT